MHASLQEFSGTVKGSTQTRVLRSLTPPTPCSLTRKLQCLHLQTGDNNAWNTQAGVMTTCRGAKCLAVGAAAPQQCHPRRPQPPTPP